MVVTVTTFLDVFVTLGFDVAFSRFYFDDKSEAARRRVITNVFYVSTIYPLILLGTFGAPHAAAGAGPARQGVRRRRLALLRRRAGDALLQQPQRPAVHALPPRAQAVDLQRLHHRPHLRAGAALHRLRGGVRLGPDGRAAGQPLHRRRHAGGPAADLHPQGRLALALAADEADAGLRHPGAVHRRLVLLAQAVRPVLPAALPGQVGGGPVHRRVLAQPAAVPDADGVPHGVAAVALRQAARAGEAPEDGLSLVHVLPRAQRAHAGDDGRLHAVDRPHLPERAVLEHRADDVRPGALRGRVRRVLRLLGRAPTSPRRTA